jgi:Tfp pilus assembly protein PilX
MRAPRLNAAARAEQGAVLLIALVLMGIITIVAASVVRFSVSGMRVAVNEELRSDAFQNAQSLVDAVLAVPQNLMIDQPVGATNCVAGISGCTSNALVLHDNTGATVTAANLTDSGSMVQVRRIAPDVSTPPRGTGYSVVRFQASFLQIESGYDGTSAGWGRAQLSEGVTAIVPMYTNGS